MYRYRSWPKQRRRTRRATENSNVVVASAAVQRAKADDAISPVASAKNLTEANGVNEQIIAGAPFKHVVGRRRSRCRRETPCHIWSFPSPAP